jgi:RNA polymerase sigma-70 factor (ECF subfamily)
VEVSESRPDRAGPAPDGFDAFYLAEYPKLVVLVAALCGRRALAEEIAQESLLRAYRDWDRVADLDRPGAWARRVAINLTWSTSRRSRREERAYSRLLIEDTVTLADPTSDKFWVEVRALPPRQRAAVALHYIEDLPLAEVADVLECSIGTVKGQLFDARRSLAKKLGAEEVR